MQHTSNTPTKSMVGKNQNAFIVMETLACLLVASLVWMQFFSIYKKQWRKLSHIPDFSRPTKGEQKR